LIVVKLVLHLADQMLGCGRAAALASPSPRRYDRVLGDPVGMDVPHPRVEHSLCILSSSNCARLAKALRVHWAHAMMAFVNKTMLVISIVVVDGSSSSFSLLLLLSLRV
jgi:hypothetical protein